MSVSGIDIALCYHQANNAWWVALLPGSGTTRAPTSERSPPVHTAQHKAPRPQIGQIRTDTSRAKQGRAPPHNAPSSPSVGGPWARVEPPSPRSSQGRRFQRLRRPPKGRRRPRIRTPVDFEAILDVDFGTNRATDPRCAPRQRGRPRPGLRQHPTPWKNLRKSLIFLRRLGPSKNRTLLVNLYTDALGAYVRRVGPWKTSKIIGFS